MAGGMVRGVRIWQERVRREQWGAVGVQRPHGLAGRQHMLVTTWCEAMALVCSPRMGAATVADTIRAAKNAMRSVLDMAALG